MHSNKMADGTEPSELYDKITGELEVRGYRKVGVDWWEHSGTRVVATVGYSSGEFRLRMFDPGQKTGAPREVSRLSRADQLDQVDSLLAAWEFIHGPASRIGS